MKHFNIAIVGATGIVGQTLLKILTERKFPIAKLFLLASDRSAGKTMDYCGKPLLVNSVGNFDFCQSDLCFFAAGDKISAEYAEKAVSCGNIVIDKSVYFRMNKDVPLVVPEVNSNAISHRPKNIIANPNCSVIPVVMALKSIQDAVGISRINIATYQSVSGSGKDGITELSEQASNVLEGKPVKPNVYAQQIAFNVLPQIDSLEENGFTREEMKLMFEIGKIFGDSSIAVNATAARVPVFYGHAAAVHIEMREKLSLIDATQLLVDTVGIRVLASPDFPTPVRDAESFDDTTVGRIRVDPTHPHGINFWVVGNNIRKGAALNAVQIAERLIS